MVLIWVYYTKAKMLVLNDEITIMKLRIGER